MLSYKTQVNSVPVVQWWSFDFCPYICFIWVKNGWRMQKQCDVCSISKPTHIIRVGCPVGVVSINGRRIHYRDRYVMISKTNDHEVRL